MLRLEARARLDRIAFITVDNKLGGLLQASRGHRRRKAARPSSAVKPKMCCAGTSRACSKQLADGKAKGSRPQARHRVRARRHGPHHRAARPARGEPAGLEPRDVSVHRSRAARLRARRRDRVRPPRVSHGCAAGAVRRRVRGRDRARLQVRQRAVASACRKASAARRVLFFYGHTLARELRGRDGAPAQAEVATELPTDARATTSSSAASAAS